MIYIKQAGNFFNAIHPKKTRKSFEKTIIVNRIRTSVVKTVKSFLLEPRALYLFWVTKRLNYF